MSDAFAVHGGLQLVQKTNLYRNRSTGESSKLEFYYLEMPVLLNVLFPLPVPFRLVPKAIVGPYASLHLFSNREVKQLGLEVNSFDFGTVIGAGIDIEWVKLEFTHNIGLVQASEDAVFDNYVITLGVELRFK
jgi:hypothetical protein